MNHFAAKKSKSETIENMFSVTCRQDKLGNIFYNIEFTVEDRDYPLNYSFDKFSSLIDFIHSNFK